MSIAIYPGTFDPLTYGHVDIVTRAATIFDSVIVAVAKSMVKEPHFSLEDRLLMCKETLAAVDGVSVDSFDGLLIDFAKTKNITIFLRGLRGAADLDVEFQLLEMNRAMLPECDTVFMKGSNTVSSISSSIVREIAAMGGDISLFVPPAVLKRIQ